MTTEPRASLVEVDFAAWSTETVASQCRMQAREYLDPEYTAFMNVVARRLEEGEAQFRDALSSMADLSSYVGAGGGDENTTADEYHERIRWGINHMTEAAAGLQGKTEPFQSRVQPWLMACFGEMIAGDREERNHRFLEEALELVQSCGCTASEAHQLVDYVYGRDVGDPPQEVGGVMVTLAALCLANGLDMRENGETELARIWTKVEAIRAKQAAKPKHSPLPQHVLAAPTQASSREEG